MRKAHSYCIEAAICLYVCSDGVCEIFQANREIRELKTFIDLISVYQQQQTNHLESIFCSHLSNQGSNVFNDDFSLIQVKLNPPQMPCNQGAEEVQPPQ